MGAAATIVSSGIYRPLSPTQMPSPVPHNPGLPHPHTIPPERTSNITSRANHTKDMMLDNGCAAREPTGLDGAPKSSPMRSMRRRWDTWHGC